MASPGVTISRKGPGLDAVLERIGELGELSATAGYQGNSGAAKAGDADMPVAQLAAIHEYGSRSYLRRGADQAREQIRREATKAFAEVVAGKAKPEDAVARVGEMLGEGIAAELGNPRGGPDLVDDDRSLERGLTTAVRKGDKIVGREERV